MIGDDDSLTRIERSVTVLFWLVGVNLALVTGALCLSCTILGRVSR